MPTETRCTILALSDLHLGRRPERAATALRQADRDDRGLGPRAVWSQTVHEAKRLGVRAVLLTGDIIDQDNRYVEALSAFRTGVEDLLNEGIRVIAVAGNHDAESLPRLADQLEADRNTRGFTLLGRGGRWESTDLTDENGTPLLRVHGWSFPRTHHKADPLEGFSPEPEGAVARGVPRIGLLHTDLDIPRSPYAPTTRAALERTGLDAWLLGHVHVPATADEIARSPHIGYLGSAIGLDPTETDRRGPWKIEVDAAGRLRFEHLPLAPLRWESLLIDAGELKHPDDLIPTIDRAIEALHDRLSEDRGNVRAVGLRAELTGETPFAEHLLNLPAENTHDYHWTRDEVFYFIDALRVDVRPKLDLQRTAEGTDPPALLARTLLTLEAGVKAEGYRSLIDDARAAMKREVDRRSDFRGLDPPELTEEAVRDHLRRAGRRALTALLAQKREEGGP